MEAWILRSHKYSEKTRESSGSLRLLLTRLNVGMLDVTCRMEKPCHMSRIKFQLGGFRSPECTEIKVICKTVHESVRHPVSITQGASRFTHCHCQPRCVSNCGLRPLVESKCFPKLNAVVVLLNDLFQSIPAQLPAWSKGTIPRLSPSTIYHNFPVVLFTTSS